MDGIEAKGANGPTWLWLGALAVAAIVLAQMPLSLNHDAAWHLNVAMQMLAGAELGSDVFDVNPPMTAWLLSIPALLSKATGLSPELSMRSFAVLVCLAAIAASAGLLRRLGFSGKALGIALLFLAFALLALPGYDFAQREQFVAAMVLPYVLLSACRLRRVAVGAAHAIVIGAVAGIAIGTKPHFLAVPLCVEIWLLAASRRPALLLRPELIAMVATGILYIVAVAVLAPAYLTEVLPDALSNYDGFETGGASLVVLLTENLAVFLFAPALYLLGRRFPGDLGIPGAVCAAAFGFIVAAALQQKGWSYHCLPAAAYAVFVLGLLVATDRQPAGLLARAGVAAALAFGLRMPVLNLIDGYSPDGTNERVKRLAALFEANPGPNDTVFAFITSPRDIHPAVLRSGLHWGNAAGAMVYLPALVKEERRAVASVHRASIYAAAERHDAQVLKDLDRLHPGVIAVDSSARKLAFEGIDFDYLEYFDRYPEFRRIWQDYRESEPIGRFRIFLRRPQSVAGAG